MALARFILAVTGTYAVIGGVFAAAFVVAGVGKVDPAARTAGVGFRLLVLPASAALWPVMLVKWARAGGGGS